MKQLLTLLSAFLELVKKNPKEFKGPLYGLIIVLMLAGGLVLVSIRLLETEDRLEIERQKNENNQKAHLKTVEELNENNKMVIEYQRREIQDNARREAESKRSTPTP